MKKESFPAMIISFLNLIKEGKRFMDKIIILLRLIICGILYPFAKILRIDLSHLDKFVIFSDIIIKNEDGEFLCRKNTSDFFIVSSVHERHLKKVLNSHIDGIFVDIGAHIGKYTLRMAKRCDLVIAIEADPQNFKILKENLRRNRIKNCIPLNFVISNRNGYGYLYYRSTFNTGSPTIIKSTKKKVRVPYKKLDDVFKELKIHFSKVRAIKIDVEGAETLVFKGAVQFLTSTKDLSILFEASDENLAECKRILKLAGFEVTSLPQGYYLAVKQKS